LAEAAGVELSASVMAFASAVTVISNSPAQQSAAKSQNEHLVEQRTEVENQASN